MTTFFAKGIPVAQGSKNAYLRGGKISLVESSKTLPKWRETVKQAAKTAHQNQPPIDAPVKVTARFFMPRPKRPRFPVPAVAPDGDKLQRAVGDALEQAGVLRNDSRIVHWDASKHYAHDGQEPGVHITIQEAE